MECLSIIIPSAVTLLTGIITGYVVAKKIAVGQIYANLMTEYRRHEMGNAIQSIWNFYDQCKKTNKDIKEEYKEIKNKEISEGYQNGNSFEETLHFKRRIVEQFYWQLATLHYNGFYFTRLSSKELQKDFTKRDSDLLEIVYQLAEATAEINKDKENKMGKLISKLHNDSRKWK